MLRRSITARLTLLFAVVSTSVLLVLGLLVESLVERHFEELDTEILWSQFDRIADVLAMAHSTEELEALPIRYPEALSNNHGMAALIISPEGKHLFVTAGSAFPDALLANARAKSQRPALWVAPDHRSFRGIASTAPSGIPGGGQAVVAIATDLSHHEHFLASFQSAFWLVVGAAALFTILFG